jgi:hypothetical protein
MIVSKKLVYFVIPLVSFFTLYSLFSLFMYQRLVNKGSVIADKQCLNVNPLIIKRKNSYVASIKNTLASGNPDDYWKEANNYLKISKKFIAAQNNWLREQKEFMDRWDFKFFLPKIVQKAAQLQYESRESNVKSSRALVELFKDPYSKKQKQLSKTIKEEIIKANIAIKKYDRLWESEKPFDWRTRFIKVPESKCPPENFDIPDVQDIFSPPQPSHKGPFSLVKILKD